MKTVKTERLSNGFMEEYGYTGNRYWFTGDIDGKDRLLHREDGPAIIIYGDRGRQRWFYQGVEYFPKDNEEWLKIMKMKAFL